MSFVNKGSRPLSGIRVLDFTTMMAGPYCTRQLADMGAEVIKVENPDGGEQNRHAVPVRDGHSAVYAHLNSGKNSIAIDLKSPDGAAIALDLATHCDIVVENSRPGVMTRLGLDCEVIRKVRPDIIYCSISGFGQTGPLAMNAAFAPVVQAISGYELENMKQQPELTKPGHVGIFFADVMAGVQAFGAISTALFSRTQTGQGQYIDVSLLESMIWLMVYELQISQNPSDTPRGLYQPVKTSDGFLMVAPGNQPTFEAMAKAMGHPEWIKDPRFQDHESRSHNYSAMMSLIESWTITKSAFVCEEILLEGKVPCARYREVSDLFDHPQLIHRDAFTKAKDPSGEIKVPNQPFKFDNSNTDARNWVEPLGKSTPDILKKLLDFEDAKIKDLRDSKIIL
ncbi:MAG: carnitine dehydratase [Alphaproteobacteria bacterium]|jgi:CoA:oxalate CoA-transferase|nr:carnitine dehydratase [Alphaproteobacteria bacterium]PPR13766.1 MAG: Acetyl-CoA:oxalate CoA-transferase [Alphaproteobacteria bacterium MarineAlpha12_Bin1]|tara:strand:- start:332 stop:1519 length:1188 start_codon:yes stop_codon:yes gene_type:complete